MADKDKEKQKVDGDQFHFLEEDDEFEEFPAEGNVFLFVAATMTNDFFLLL